MINFSEFFYAFFSQSLNEELEIWFDNVEHEPENGIFYEFEWEAVDEKNKDRKNDLSVAEHNEIVDQLKNYLRHNYSKQYEDY
jgi:hypothetical protein